MKITLLMKKVAIVEIKMKILIIIILLMVIVIIITMIRIRMRDFDQILCQAVLTAKIKNLIVT
jgi:hypothetical protein